VVAVIGRAGEVAYIVRSGSRINHNKGQSPRLVVLYCLWIHLFFSSPFSSETSVRPGKGGGGSGEVGCYYQGGAYSRLTSLHRERESISTLNLMFISIINSPPKPGQ